MPPSPGSFAKSAVRVGLSDDELDNAAQDGRDQERRACNIAGFLFPTIRPATNVSNLTPFRMRVGGHTLFRCSIWLRRALQGAGGPEPDSKWCCSAFYVGRVSPVSVPGCQGVKDNLKGGGQAGFLVCWRSQPVMRRASPATCLCVGDKSIVSKPFPREKKQATESGRETSNNVAL
jgi:hypothetical protein